MSEKTRLRRMGAVGAAGALVLAFAGGACGGGGGGGTADGGASGGSGGSTVNDGTPPGQCREFVATFCDRLIKCDPPDGGAEGCTALYNVAVGCDRATSAKFPLCTADVKALSCAGLGLDPQGAGFQSPASCDEPLNIPSSDAQKKCGTIAEVLCDPIDVCQSAPPTTDPTFVDCVNQAYFDIGCPFAVSESATYSMCLDDLCSTAATAVDAGTADDGGLVLPTTCSNVIVGPT